MNSLKKGQSSGGLHILLVFYVLLLIFFGFLITTLLLCCGILFFFCALPLPAGRSFCPLRFRSKWLMPRFLVFVFPRKSHSLPWGLYSAFGSDPFPQLNSVLLLSHILWWSFSSPLWHSVYKFIFDLFQYIFCKLQDICAWNWWQFGERKRP